jgi:PAS domain S-box-containing protein
MTVNADRPVLETRESQAEEKYRTILESIDEGYYETNLAGNFVFSNDSMCRILACRKEELIGSNFRAYVDRSTARDILKAFNRVYTSGEGLKNVEWQFQRPDKSRLYGEISVTRILSAHGECTGFRGLVRDVTRRAEAERALMESERRHQLVAENVSDIIWTTDLDFNITYVSPSVKRITGASMGKALRLNVSHIMKPEEFEKFKADIQETFARYARGEVDRDFVKRFEFEFTRADSTVFWAEAIASGNFDENGTLLGLVGITRDITERVRAAEENRKNEAKYRTILESIEEGYFETDLRGCFTFFNDAMCRIIGYPEGELTGMSYRRLLDERNLEKLYRSFNRVSLTGKPEKGIVWEYLRDDCSKIPVEGSIQLMRDAGATRPFSGGS